MLKSKSLIVAVCLAVLPWISTTGSAAPGRTDSKPKHTATAKKTHEGSEKKAVEKDEQSLAQLRASVLSSSLGIHTADEAASAIYQIATAEPLDSGDIRMVAEFAERAVDKAKTSTKQMEDSKLLSAQEKTDARAAFADLEEAHKTLAMIKRRPGVMKGYYDKLGAKDVGQDAVQLHTQIDHANQTLDKIAKAHRLSTNLNFPTQPLARNN